VEARKKMKTLALFLSFFLSFVAGEYYDDDARNMMFPLAAAAYSNNSDVCLKNVDPNSAIHRQFSFKCDIWDDTCAGYTAVSHTYETIIISFRGTNSKLQLVPEIWDSQFLVPFIGGKVAEYFLRGFNDLWNGGMKDSVNILKNKYPSYDIICTGHSLGGALAALAAATIVTTNIKPAYNVALYTFGQPRTGNEDFALAFDDLEIEAFRIVHKRDPVPHSPELDTLIDKEGNYWHHGEEIWYNNDMTTSDTFIECPLGEDPRCSDSDNYYDLTFGQHLNYFGHTVSDYGIAGCPSVYKKSHKLKLKHVAANKRPNRAKRLQNRKA
jgi:hypothetical protein